MVFGFGRQFLPALTDESCLLAMERQDGLMLKEPQSALIWGVDA